MSALDSSRFTKPHRGVARFPFPCLLPSLITYSNHWNYVFITVFFGICVFRFCYFGISFLRFDWPDSLALDEI